MDELHCFDPDQPVSIVDRKLPHWSQPGVVCFITFRTHDSLPAETIHHFQEERASWLMNHGIDWRKCDWQTQLKRLSRQTQREFHRTFSRRWHENLDRCCGQCRLAAEENTQDVRESLLHFDEKRYILSNFVIMPNHVHLLVAMKDEYSMHFTMRIVEALHRSPDQSKMCDSRAVLATRWF